MLEQALTMLLMRSPKIATTGQLITLTGGLFCKTWHCRWGVFSEATVGLALRSIYRRPVPRGLSGAAVFLATVFE